jgi:hypothetical protein
LRIETGNSVDCRKPRLLMQLLGNRRVAPDQVEDESMQPARIKVARPIPGIGTSSLEVVDRTGHPSPKFVSPRLRVWPNKLFAPVRPILRANFPSGQVNSG